MDFKEQLKSSVDIVKVIGEYVRLRKSGVSRYTGLCPFHSEKTPSFSVHAGHQFYKCFGCGASGDVLKFVMEFEHVSFPEALKLLAERNGIPMPKRAEYADAETRLRAAVFQIQELAQEAFREQLAGPAGAEARRYLEKRGVSPEVERAIRAGIRRALGPRAAAHFGETGVHGRATGELRSAGPARRRQLLRPLPQPADVSHPQRIREGDRIRRARARSGRRSQVLEFRGIADI